MTKKHQQLTFIIILFVILAGLAAWYFHHRSLYPETDDAYVGANTVDISAQVTGPVNAIMVENYQHVTKGQVLFTILPTNYQAALSQAIAQELQTRLNAKRITQLAKKGFASQSDADLATEQWQTAQAQLAQAKLNLQFTQVTAPQSGQLINFNLRIGSTVNPNITLFSIIEDQGWWVDANYKETQLERIHPGQKAEVYLDMYPDHKFIGTVYQISGGSGESFSLLPAENATGNWVKITQRFPVRILLDNNDPDHLLRVGASATTEIDTTH